MASKVIDNNLVAEIAQAIKGATGASGARSIAQWTASLNSAKTDIQFGTHSVVASGTFTLPSTTTTYTKVADYVSARITIIIRDDQTYSSSDGKNYVLSIAGHEWMDGDRYFTKSIKDGVVSVAHQTNLLVYSSASNYLQIRATDTLRFPAGTYHYWIWK